MKLNRTRNMDSSAMQPSTPAADRKRKRHTSKVDQGHSDPSKRHALSPSPSPSPKKKAKTTKVNPPAGEEKRLRRFRPQPPQSFHDIYARATTQRFYVLSRRRLGTVDCPEEMVEVTGSTGNIYHVVIARLPTCDCPHAKKGNQCKHVVYVLARVLRAKFEYVYQLALLSTELHDILAHAPSLADEHGASQSGSGDKDGKRKPIDADCPICFEKLETATTGEDKGEEESEAIVWCRAACGQNIHKECFELWAATKRQQAPRGAVKSEVTCPYCRSVWQGDEDMVRKINKAGPLTEEGYVNVADQLGISPVRDTSTYSSWWSGHANSYRRRRAP
ncbi:E3 ubiquitin-protein ligase Zswim2 [Diplogelasinospora grovesii]|uniref:E3 ubiquitin-protein ligase Zswim2 n=1 Tax=Diplogelasinospora grovesii TaxID=303347 RepID=A0AAN6S6M2_9PEZI|nr:E3 ubiquitin-protein ligase Zswim2 [Diplogelasinospora grovesii]